MKRGVWLVLAALTVAAPAFADDQQQIDCGEFTNENTSHQFGRYAWLEYIVETRRPVTLCAYYVEVEAHVVGVSGSAATKMDLFTASVRRQVPVPGWGRYQTNGKHTRILLWLSLQATAPLSATRTWGRRRLEDCSVYNGGGEGLRLGHARVTVCGVPRQPDHRRHGPRRLPAHEREERRPLRSECGRHAGKNGVDAA